MRDPLLQALKSFHNGTEGLAAKLDAGEISPADAIKESWALVGIYHESSGRQLSVFKSIASSGMRAHLGNTLENSKRRLIETCKFVINIVMKINIQDDENLKEVAPAVLGLLDFDVLEKSLAPNPSVKRLAVKFYRTAFKEAFDTLNRKQRDGFFERLKKGDSLEEFIEQGEFENSLLPYSILTEARRWKKQYDQQQSLIPPSLPTSDVENLVEVSAAPEIPQNILTVVEVEDLLPEGVADDLGALGARERGEEGVDIRTQPRLEWVLSALQEDGFELKDMILYREKMVEGYNPERSGYRVLEVLKENHHFQIAVSEIVGNATYIIRNPIDFKDDATVTVADLKMIDTVFQTACYTPKQWARSIRKYAYTPLEELQVQLKTRIGWGDKYNAVKESLGLFYCETGQLPFVHDQTIIEFGPLAGKTTFARLYHALHRQAIPGLEHVRNFPDLRDHIFGANIDIKATAEPVPEQPVLAFDAHEIFVKAVLDIHATGNIPDLGEEFDKSLNAKKVSNLDKVVIGNPDNITSVSAFLVATGVAVETGDGIIQPASPVVIAQFARFIQA